MRVLIDGQPAPLLYVSSTQINAVAPFRIAEKKTAMLQVETASGERLEVEVPVTNAMPAVFAMRMPGSSVSIAKAINQDGSINSLQNPAARGSIVSIWVSGVGLLNPTPADGMLASSTDSRPSLAVTAMFDDRPAEVVYAGPSPGLINGLMQVNVRIPQILTGFGVTLKIGDQESPPAELAIR